MADPNLKDFLGALNDFKSGLQDFNRTRIIQQANEKVQQIRSSDEAEANKRQALQNVSNELVGFLAGDNTPATTIQEVVKAFGQPAGTPAQEISQAVMTGNQAQLDLAKQAALETRSVGEGKAEEFRSKLFKQQADLQRELAGIRSSDRSAKEQIAAAKLDNKSRDELTANFSVLDAILDLNKEVTKLGSTARIAGGYGGARASAQLARTRSKAEALKVQIARAAESGVLSDQDLKRYNDILGGLGDFKTLGSFKAGYEAFAFKSKNIIKNRLATLEGEGKNMSAVRTRLKGYDDELPQDAPGVPPGLPPGTVPVTINGVVGAGFRLPDGTIVKPKKKVN